MLASLFLSCLSFVKADPCANYVWVSEKEFTKNWNSYQDLLQKPVVHKKEGDKVIITNARSKVVFQDSPSILDSGLEYSIFREDLKNGLVLVEGFDEHHTYYFLVNEQTLHVDTLAGYPRVYGDTIMCYYDPYTDEAGKIEIWLLKKNRVELIKRVFWDRDCTDASPLLLCDECVYYHGGAVYYKTPDLKTDGFRFLKISITK